MNLPKKTLEIDWQAPTARLAIKINKGKTLQELVREMRWRRWAKKGNKQ